jgi:hypothetical protein
LSCVASFVVFALVAGESQAQRAGGGTFAAMAGSWSGTGTITLANGGNERIRCRSTNTVGGTGDSAQLTLRCASDSYRFDLNSNVTAQGGTLSGTWSETTRNVSGNVSGSASPGQVQAQVSAQGFAANLYMTTKGNQQAVSISSAGTELSRVTLTMTKGGG